MADFKHKPHRDRDSAGQLRKGNSKWQIPSRLASAFVRTSSTTSASPLSAPVIAPPSRLSRSSSPLATRPLLLKNSRRPPASSSLLPPRSPQERRCPSEEPSVCRYQGDGLIASDPEGALVSFPPEKKRTDFSALFFVFSKDESQPAGVVEPDSHYLFRLTTLS